MSRYVLFFGLLVLLGCRGKEKEVSVIPEKNLAGPGTLWFDDDFLKTHDSLMVAQEAQKVLIGELIKSSRDPDELALSFPQPWRAVYTVNLLDSQVLIHGFDVYFREAQSALIEPTMEDLKFIGAMKHYEIFDRVRKIVVQERTSKRTKTNRFISFDKEYSDLKPSLAEILGTFIQQHPELYTKPKQ
jgi:hypothetical protein